MTTEAPSVVVLGETLAAHLVRALTQHQRWCRTNAVAWPHALDDLIGALAASGGPRRTAVAPRASDDDSGAHEAELLTITYRGAAVRLGVSERTVRRLVADRRLPTVVVGGCSRVRVADLGAYVDNLGVRS